MTQEVKEYEDGKLALITKVENTIVFEPITPEEAAEWAAENKFA